MSIHTHPAPKDIGKAEFTSEQIAIKTERSLLKSITAVESSFANMSYSTGAHGNHDQLHHDPAELERIRHESLDARLYSPFVIKASLAVKAYAASRPVNFGSKNNELDALVKRLVSMPMTDAYSALDNIEKELVDGSIVIQMTALGSETVIAKVVDPNEYDAGSMILSFDDGSTPWMHSRTYHQSSKSITVFYPDVHFYPDPTMSAVIEQYVEDMQVEGVVKTINWNVRVLRHDFNYGLPVLFPMLAFIQCLESIIQLQSSVLQSIASTATVFSIQDDDEREDAYKALNQVRAGDDHITDRAQALLDKHDAGTVTTSGKGQVLNLNVAMLGSSSALYELLLANVYNSIGGLAPTDFHEEKKFSLGDQGSSQGGPQVSSAKIRQQEHAGLLRRVLEGSLLLLASLGRDLPGVDILTYDIGTMIDSGVNDLGEELEPIRAGQTVAVLEYEDEEEEIFIEFPEVQVEDAQKTIDAIVTAITLGGKLENPLGSPEFMAKELQRLGIDLKTDRREWGAIAFNGSNSQGNNEPNTTRNQAGSQTNNNSPDSSSDADDETDNGDFVESANIQISRLRQMATSLKEELTNVG